MKTYKKFGLSMLVGMLAASTSAIGYDDKTTDESASDKKVSKLEKALAKYERTGEKKSCLNPARIRSSRVIDDFHIIFEERGRKVYLNTLPRKCPTLGFHRAIKYTVRGSSICKNDLFEVFDANGIGGPGCSFGAFEELEKKNDKDDGAKKTVPE